MTQQIITISGTELLKVKLVQSGLPYSAESKFAGKTYSRFRYQGVIFIVPDHDAFVQDFAEGRVHELTLIEGTRDVTTTDDAGVETTDQVRTLAFDAAITHAQYDGVIDAQMARDWKQAEHQHKIATLGKPVVTEELLKALEEKLLG